MLPAYTPRRKGRERYTLRCVLQTERKKLLPHQGLKESSEILLWGELLLVACLFFIMDAKEVKLKVKKGAHLREEEHCMVEQGRL